MKIGVFGGAFDPVHIGHTALAEKIRSFFALDKLFFVPSEMPPHKSPHEANGIDRLTMLKIAAVKLGDGFEVSDFEINSSGVSYTFDTLSHFRDEYPDGELYFIAGSDIFSTIKSWKNWRELFGLAKFIIVKRVGNTFENMIEKIGGGIPEAVVIGEGDEVNEKERLILFDVDIPEVSSTFIRENIDGVFGLVDNAVLEYIKQNKLYKEA